MGVFVCEKIGYDRNMIYFITGNAGKLAEAQAIIPEIEGLAVDLPEIQDIDPEAIIKAKLLEAQKHLKKPVACIVEDTSLYMDCLNGLPGPLIKWFLKRIGTDGLAELAQRYNNAIAYAETHIGYMDTAGEIHFFVGRVDGMIVKARGDTGFGWDAIFVPDGHNKTFAEMTSEEKNAISHRRIALDNLRDFLENKSI